MSKNRMKCTNTLLHLSIRAAAHQLRQDKHQDTRQKKQKLTSASWFRLVCGGFHNLIPFNCAPFFASCHRHNVLTLTCLDAYRCAAYLRLRTVWQTYLKPNHFAVTEFLIHRIGERPSKEAVIFNFKVSFVILITSMSNSQNVIDISMR
jgi:hypothetical protein